MSAPFSASSVNAIVAVVIVEISLGHGWWVAPQPYPGPRWPPPTGIAVAARQAASGYALRASPRRKTYTTSWDINYALSVRYDTGTEPPPARTDALSP